MSRPMTISIGAVVHRIFTESGFAQVLRAGDSRRFNINLKTNRDDIIKEAMGVASEEDISSNGIFRTRIKNRNCISIKDYSKNLIFRAVSRYLARRFRIYPRNRDSIVREIVETLSDSTPMYIIRRDLSSFYESLPTAGVRDMLEFNTYIPTKIRNYIRHFFSTLCGEQKGVPRGVGISAVISEIVMQETDQRIREIEGIYKYFRYSDDILIFSYDDPCRLYGPLDEIIKPTGLKFNRTKSKEMYLNCAEKSKRKNVEIEYLGYKFSMLNGHGDDRPRAVEVSISDGKISRIKTRIICSLKAYQGDRDFQLLLDRIRFLSSNYFAYRAGAHSVKTSKFVKSGIHYNYHLCGRYQAGRRLPSRCSELKSLDAFYHALIKGPSSSFRHLFETRATENQLRRLEKISFFRGFEHKITVRFRPDRVHQIKAAWRNA